jgi:hypothetical protein
MLGKAVFGVILFSAAVFAPDGAFAIQLSTYFAFPTRPNALVVVQVDTPKTEAILRKTIQDLQEGKPDFSTMEPELQKAIKEQAQHTADIYRHRCNHSNTLQPKAATISIARCIKTQQ